MKREECRTVEDGYLLNDEHYDDCEGECAGCFPCVPRSEHGDPLTHCTARGRCTEHVPVGVLSCPRCVGKVRHNLRRLVDLSALLSAAAIEAARIESEAANLAGPAADPSVWAARNVQAALAGLPTEDDPDHPYLVLGRWDLMLREEYGPETNQRITVARAADYLDSQLDRLAQDPEQDFGLFAREVADCLTHIEHVLAVAMFRENGAPCPACREEGTDKPARLVMHRDDRDKTGASDRWRCPANRNHQWSDAEYRLRVGKDHIAHAPKLPLTEMSLRTDVPAGTLRRWASKQRVQLPGRPVVEHQPLLRPVGKAEDGRKVYRVADVVALRDGVCMLDIESAS